MTIRKISDNFIVFLANFSSTGLLSILSNQVFRLAGSLSTHVNSLRSFARILADQDRWDFSSLFECFCWVPTTVQLSWCVLPASISEARQHDTVKLNFLGSKSVEGWNFGLLNQITPHVNCKPGMAYVLWETGGQRQEHTKQTQRTRLYHEEGIVR